MKRTYTAPEAEITKFTLNPNIATGMLSNITDGGTWDDWSFEEPGTF